MRVLRWIGVIVAWTIALLAAALVAFVLYMDGRPAVWCGDDICHADMGWVVGLSVVAVVAFVIGWVVRPAHRGPSV